MKKELSILSSLRHEHVIKLFGVMFRPLGLVLELSPRGSLKKMLDGYAENVLVWQRVELGLPSPRRYGTLH